MKTKSTLIASIEKQLSSFDKDLVLNDDEREAFIEILLAASDNRKPIDQRRSEHYPMLSNLICLHGTVKLRLKRLQAEKEKRSEDLMQKEKNITGKFPTKDRTTFLQASDESTAIIIDMIDDASVFVELLDKQIDAFKQRSFAINEESIETRKDREAASSEF